MPDSWNIIGWLLICGFAVMTLVCLGAIAKILIDIQIAEWRYRRANAGKLRCQDPEPCYAMATRQTPNGFFCDAHWADHSEKKTLHGSVRYAIPLDWSKD